MMIETKQLLEYFEWADNRIIGLLEIVNEDQFNKIIGGRSLKELCIHLINDYDTLVHTPIDAKQFDKLLGDLNKKPKRGILEYWKQQLQKFKKVKVYDNSEFITPPFANNLKIPWRDYILLQLQHSSYHRGQVLTTFKSLNPQNEGINLDLGTYVYQ